MKGLTIFLACFLLSSSLALAYDSQVLIQHGPDLMKASFPIRYAFWNQKHKEWPYSTYNERKKFLIAWYVEQDAKRKIERRKAKEQAIADRELQKAKKDDKKRLAMIKKADEQAIRSEHKEVQQENKAFDNDVHQADKILSGLQRQSGN